MSDSSCKVIFFPDQHFRSLIYTSRLDVRRHTRPYHIQSTAPYSRSSGSESSSQLEPPSSAFAVFVAGPTQRLRSDAACRCNTFSPQGPRDVGVWASNTSSPVCPSTNVRVPACTPAACSARQYIHPLVFASTRRIAAREISSQGMRTLIDTMLLYPQFHGTPTIHLDINFLSNTLSSSSLLTVFLEMIGYGYRRDGHQSMSQRKCGGHHIHPVSSGCPAFLKVTITDGLCSTRVKATMRYNLKHVMTGHGK